MLEKVGPSAHSLYKISTTLKRRVVPEKLFLGCALVQPMEYIHRGIQQGMNCDGISAREKQMGRGFYLPVRRVKLTDVDVFGFAHAE